MPITDYKFNESEFLGRDIISLPDRPGDAGITAAELKARFDHIPKMMIALGKFNNMIDALMVTKDSDSGADNIGATAIPSVSGNTVQSVLEGLKAYADSLALSSGVVTSVFGRAGAVLPQAGDYTLPEVGGSRVQMLDNACWAVPSAIVNQRIVTTHTTGHGIDRWFLENSGTGTLSVTSNGLVFTASGGINRFNQRLETWKTGQRVTFSLLMDSIVGSGFLNILGHTGTDWVTAGTLNFDSSNKLVQISGIVPSGITVFMVRIGAYDGATITMIASKLEAGEGQTLAHQDANGNWVLNDPPPDLQESLSACLRYQFIENGANRIFGTGYAVNATTAIVYIPTPTPLRINPTITFSELYLWHGTLVGVAGAVVSGISSITAGKNGIIATFATTGLIANEPVLLQVRTGGYFIADSNM